MKRMYLWGIMAIVGLGLLGYYLGWIDNGPKEINTEEIPSRFEE